MYIEKMLGSRMEITAADLQAIGERTADYSFSDMRCYCKEAAMVSVREKIVELKGKGGQGKVQDKTLKKLNMQDLLDTLDKVRPSPKFSMEKYLDWEKN